MIGLNSYLQAAAVQPDGKTLIGGFFKAVGGQAYENMARLEADGTVDAGFTANTNFGVYSVALQNDGKILLGGAFTSVNDTGRNFFARINADGSLESTSTFNPGTGTDGVVYSVALQTDGKILLGGQFTTVNGEARNHIARINADGSPENTSTFNSGTGANDAVYSVVVQPDGKILIAGAFTSVNGTTRSHIARLDANGSLDGSFNPGTGADDKIAAIALQADGKILVGGFFTVFNGTARSRIVRLNADGSLDGSFNPGNGTDGNIHSIALQANGKILVGGTFTTIDGQSYNRIARLNTDGSVDDAFNPGSGADAGVDCVALQADGKILLGGSGVTKLTTSGTTGVFTVNVIGFVRETGYSFKAYATNSVGTTYSTPVATFTSAPRTAPIVGSPTSTNILADTATLGGTVTGDGGAAITERGVVISKTSVNSNPSIGGSGVTKLTTSGTTGIFTVNVIGFARETGYSFKAYATNSVGATYSNPVATFTSAPPTPRRSPPSAPTPATTLVTSWILIFPSFSSRANRRSWSPVCQKVSALIL